MGIYNVIYKKSTDSEMTAQATYFQNEQAMTCARWMIDEFKKLGYRGQASYVFDGSTRMMASDNGHYLFIAVVEETICKRNDDGTCA